MTRQSSEALYFRKKRKRIAGTPARNRPIILQDLLHVTLPAMSKKRAGKRKKKGGSVRRSGFRWPVLV
ncbi:MAG: hypothetical protein ACOCSR_01095, partial [Wenzhouxiangella sp.]